MTQTIRINANHILAIAPKAKNVDDLVRCINQWAPAFVITTPLRMAHFLSQAAHETAGFTRLTEIASGQAYEGNRILGNTQPGDGVRFRGRGLLQLTGRSNYEAYARSPFCNGDLMSHPEWLATFPGAVKSAMWFWWSRSLNAMADADLLTAITRRINGGTNGLAQRRAYLARAKKALKVK